MPIDMSAAKAPPAKRAAAKKAAPTPPPATADAQPMSLREQRFEGLMGLASLVQGGLLMAGLHADAYTVGKYIPPVAIEVAKIAEDNDTIAKPLDILIKVGPYAGLLVALQPFVMQLLANHRVIDVSKAIGQGIVPPEVLEAQMKAEMMRMQAEAFQAQQQAINEANAAAESYAKMMQPAEATS